MEPTVSPNMKERIARIFVVEDHPMFRERLAQMINAEPDMQLCGEADNADDALRLIRETAPDLALVDVTLKGSSGLVLIKSLKALGIAIPTLVLSMHDEATYASRTIRAGASGYITKHRAANDVLSAIRSILAGDVYLSEQGAVEIARSFAVPGAAGQPRSVARLTDRELEVLRLLGAGQTTREIAQTLKLSVASIDTYRARIKEKMNLRNAAELQTFATRWLSEQE
jgi:DNA-binding NarL/FixJ family response regulator